MLNNKSKSKSKDINKGKGKDKDSILNSSIKELSSNLFSVDSKKKITDREVELRNQSLFKLMNDKDISSLDFRDALLFRLNDIKKYGILNMLSINFRRIFNVLTTIYLYIVFFVIFYGLMRIFKLNIYSVSDIVLVIGISFIYLIYFYFKVSKEIQIVFPYLKYIYFGKYRLIEKK